MSNLVVTGTSEAPCKCCVGEGDVSLTCRTKGGLAALCGHAEFASPSTPPLLYHTLTANGTNVSANYTDSGCTVPAVPSGNSCTHAGSVVYDADDCSVVTSGGFTCTGGQSGGVTTDLGSSNCFITVSKTPTTQSAAPTGFCCPDGGIFSKQVTFGLILTLSDEDTEEQAIARLLASVDWSDYGANCAAGWEPRTIATTFLYQEAEFKVDMSSLTPGGNYLLKLKVYRSVWGMGDFVLLYTLIYPVTADGSGNAQVTGTIPNDNGFDTMVANPYVAAA